MAHYLRWIVGLTACLTVSVIGCGGGEQSAEELTEKSTPEINPGEPGSGISDADVKTAKESPTVSINPPKQQEPSAAAAPSVVPPKDSPEWFLFAIKNYPRPGAEKPSPLGLAIPADLTARDEAIIRFAQQAIGKSFKDEAKKTLFTDAVHQLLEARYRMALRGKPEDVDLLYDDANELAGRFPDSTVAADATYILAQFAYKNARDFGKQEPRWLDEFAKQSRLFAKQFPSEQVRAPRLLFYAGWSCELHGKIDLAKACYGDLKTLFAETREGQQATAMLVRLNLVGQPLQLGGGTIDGGYVSDKDLLGHVSLIVFWSSENERFLKQLPILKSVSEKYLKYGVVVVGVCLDENEAGLSQFLEQQNLNWRQIYDPAHQRFDNRIAKHYGIRDIPTVWVADHKGIVRDLFVDPDKLELQVQNLIRAAQAQP
ncbi:MAG: TlpA disulfide reductase family protein [Planctomycetota bacterium]|nr:TlpA disulfide reductase family protein [Planctomycetota bacterium]